MSFNSSINDIISSNSGSINIKEKLNQCKVLYDMDFALIPIAPKSKKPFSPLLPEVDGKKSWSPLAKRRASWIEIEYWIKNHPEINIGIITGKISNLVVLDIDNRYDKDGNLNVKSGPKIITPKVITTRDNHIYFRCNKKIDSGILETPSGKKIGEISGDYRYVLAPPSIHPSGKKYKWAEENNIINQKLFDYKNIKFEKNKENDQIIITTEDYYNNHLKENNDKKQISISQNKNSSNKTLDKWWHKLQTEFEVAQKIFDLAGVDVKGLGKNFECPFHEDKHPSASIFQVAKEDLNENQAPNNAIYFSDFHQKGRDKYYNPETDKNKYLPQNGSKQQWFNLGEVFFAIETDKELQKLDKGVGVIWWIRALDKLGYINNLPSIAAKKLPKTENTIYRFKKDKQEYAIKKESVEKVYNGFIYLLKLKTIYDKNQKGTTYSYRFIASWCNINKNTAAKAMRYLMQKKYIRVIKRTKSKKANILDINRS